MLYRSVTAAAVDSARLLILYCTIYSTADYYIQETGEPVHLYHTRASYLNLIIYGGINGEEHTLKVLENRVLRRIFGPKGDEVTGDWRNLHSEELLTLYSSPSIIRMIKSRRMRWAGHLARMREKSYAYSILVGKPEGKRPLGRPRRGWADNTEMDLRETGWGGMDWIDLAQDRDRWRALVNTVMNLWVP
jgi:hypothetical protein